MGKTCYKRAIKAQSRPETASHCSGDKGRKNGWVSAKWGAGAAPSTTPTATGRKTQNTQRRAGRGGRKGWGASFGFGPGKAQARPTEHFISRLVDSRRWKDLAGSVSPSLSDESSPPPGDRPPKFFALLPPDAILQCRHFISSLFINTTPRESLGGRQMARCRQGLQVAWTRMARGGGGGAAVWRWTHDYCGELKQKV